MNLAQNIFNNDLIIGDLSLQSRPHQGTRCIVFVPFNISTQLQGYHARADSTFGQRKHRFESWAVQRSSLRYSRNQAEDASGEAQLVRNKANLYEPRMWRDWCLERKIVIYKPAERNVELKSTLLNSFNFCFQGHCYANCGRLLSTPSTARSQALPSWRTPSSTPWPDTSTLSRSPSTFLIT